MTARNALCPCGSGKKFKYCHGGFQSAPDSGAVPSSPATPRETESHVAQALKSGNADQAIELARALPAGVRRVRLLVAACIRRGRAEDINEAIGQLENWHKERPGDAEAIQRLLETSLYQDRLPDALDWLNKLRNCSGSTIHLGYYQAVIHQLQGQPKKALSRLVALQPQPSSGDRLQDCMIKVDCRDAA